jgi:hypothetical protein
VAEAEKVGLKRDNTISRNPLNVLEGYTRLNSTCCFYFSSFGRVLGRGLVSGGDPLTKLVACMGRVLTRDPCPVPGVPTYIHVGNMVAECVKEQVATHVQALPRGHCVGRATLFKLLKNKPRSYVEALILHMHDSGLGWQSKSWKTKGFFVKNESNIKKSLARARGIYPMSEVMCYYLAPILEVQEVIYGTTFMKKFQIKHLSSKQIYKKLETIFAQDHFSTDYSSFERGITDKLRTPEAKIVSDIMRQLGFHASAIFFEVMIFKPRKIKDRFYSFKHFSRCSGDYWTSMGNGIVNICIIMAGHYDRYRQDYTDDEEWFAAAKQLDFVVEGDDGMIPACIANPTFVNSLGIPFSTAVAGRGGKNVDFLRRMWTMDGCVLNILRSVRSLWVKTDKPIKLSKRMFLLRAAALSMHYNAPGHVVLRDIVDVVGRLTAGCSAFKGWEKYFDQHNFRLEGVNVAAKFPVVEPNYHTDYLLADSEVPSIPPISLYDQEALSVDIQRFSGSSIETLGIFKMYDEFEEMELSDEYFQPRRIVGRMTNPGVKQLYDFLIDPAGGDFTL